MSDETTTTAGPRAGYSPALDSLVARTTGLQPWRKALHALSAMVIATGIQLFGTTHAAWVLIGLAVAAAIGFGLDAVRLWSVKANELFFRAFGKLASPREARGVASSSWYALGALLTAALFPPATAV